VDTGLPPCDNGGVKRREDTGLAVWNQWDLGNKQPAVWSFPERRIYLERVEQEWHVLCLAGEKRVREASRTFIERSRKPASSEWRHYLSREQGPVRPKPVLPDRAIVAKPDRSLTLLAGESAQFFLEIPVWFRMNAGGDREIRIFEEPLAVMSNTWFGDPVNGELCYALATRLHQGMSSIVPTAWRAVCPMAVTNDSATDLAFERICLHVQNLAVFRGDERLWTNGLSVLFRGPDQASHIQVSPGPPEVEPGLAPASPARVPAESWDIRKTFSRIREFADF
jgi:hypothetical protein